MLVDERLQKNVSSFHFANKQTFEFVKNFGQRSLGAERRRALRQHVVDANGRPTIRNIEAGADYAAHMLVIGGRADRNAAQLI